MAETYSSVWRLPQFLAFHWLMKMEMQEQSSQTILQVWLHKTKLIINVQQINPNSVINVHQINPNSFGELVINIVAHLRCFTVNKVWLKYSLFIIFAFPRIYIASCHKLFEEKLLSGLKKVSDSGIEHYLSYQYMAYALKQ